MIIASAAGGLWLWRKVASRLLRTPPSERSASVKWPSPPSRDATCSALLPPSDSAPTFSVASEICSPMLWAAMSSPLWSPPALTAGFPPVPAAAAAATPDVLPVLRRPGVVPTPPAAAAPGRRRPPPLVPPPLPRLPRGPRLRTEETLCNRGILVSWVSSAPGWVSNAPG